MAVAGVELLRAAIDELAQADVVGRAQRDDLVGLWREMARLEAQFARRLAELDTSVEWSVDGSRSAAGWLVANLRAASGDAHHRMKVARQTAEMPITNAAWQDGRISSRHVDALTRVRHGANADGEFAVFEPVLVDVARQGRPEDVANVGRQWRDALDSQLDRDGADRRKSAEYDRRHVNYSRSIRGLGFLDGVFEPEGAALADTALRHAVERTRGKNDPRSPGQLRADAMADIFRHYLDQQSRGTNRPHLMMAVDPATYSGETVGLSETFSGHRLHPDTLRRLACDSIIQRIVLDSDGVPLDMGRATRTFTPDQYRAIMLRDGGCRMPGCDAGPQDCEAHHALIHWDDGGPTDISNGLALCRGTGHHRLIHEGGWTVTGDPNGEITFHDPDGNERGTSRPRRRPPPIATRAGIEVTRAQERAHELRTFLPSPRAA
ncbi:MAG: hypothetical protein QOE62_1675 [Actinomycetota bacterium]|nr:hypothetical protein [Actinomycetota bacterium]